MGSVVEGYTYDIFISYRRKDNLAAEKEVSGWVSEFVARLRNEIQTVIKEDISVYFDENEYDGRPKTEMPYSDSNTFADVLWSFKFCLAKWISGFQRPKLSRSVRIEDKIIQR